MSFPTGWIYRQPVTVDNTTANGGGLFVVSNFQVPIALNSGNFAFSSANASGSDLVVTADSAGATVLNFWLQAYNSTAQTGTLWVQVPFLAEGATTTVYLWYGNAAWTASLGSYAATMTKLASGSGITELYHCDDGTGSTLAEAGGGTAATIVGGPPTWETVDGGIGLNGIQYVNVASPDFALTGSGWTYLRGLPYVDSSYYGPNGGTGLNTATWTIPNLAPGTYNVSVTYLQLGNRSAAAPFKVYDGATLLTSVNVNQQNAPAGITDAFGTTWTVLDATAVINSGTCVVTLTDNTSGYVIAGTVRLAPTLCNAPFSGAAISLNGTSQCVTIPGFQGVSMPAAGAIMFWYRNEAAGQIGTNTTLVSLFANGTGGSSSVPGNALWIYLSSNNVANVPQTITLNLATYVGGVAATTSAVLPTDQNWHHFCYTWSPDIREVWIDGTLLLMQRTNQNGSVGLFNGQSAVNNLTIGALSQEDGAQTPHYSATPTNWFATSLDEIAVLNHQPLPSEIYSAVARRQYQTGMWQDGRWTKQGAIVTPPAWSGANSGTALEPAVLYLSSGSQVMALSDGGSYIGELTSTTGGLGTWSDPGGNPTEAGGHGSQLLLDGSTYYWFWTDGTTVWAQTSTTAAPGSWGTKTALYTVTSIGQAWAASSLWSPCIFRDPNDNTWKAFQEALGSGYQIGFLTTGSSTLAGATWTPYAGNPLSSLTFPSQVDSCHPDVHCNLRGSGTYDIWYHTYDGTNSFVCHATSTNLTTWTNLELVLRLSNENFSGLGADQLADPHVYYMAGQCRMYYDIDAEVSVAANIQAATYNNTLANLLVDPPLLTLGAAGPVVPAGLLPSATRRPVWDYTGSRRPIYAE